MAAETRSGNKRHGGLKEAAFGFGNTPSNSPFPPSVAKGRARGDTFVFFPSPLLAKRARGSGRGILR
jgi:hypothetical protein